MARKRMIDPSIWADEDFGSLSSEAQIFYIGLISNADDEGRLPGNALFLASTIFPYKGLNQKQAQTVRDEVLSKMHSAMLYVVDGKEYIQLKNWLDYQSINKPSESKYPPLPDNYRSTTVALPPNRIEENRKEKKRTEERVRETFFSVETLTDGVCDEIAEIKQVDARAVYKLREQLQDYVKSNGKRYKDYRAALMSWVNRRIDEGKLTQSDGKKKIVLTQDWS